MIVPVVGSIDTVGFMTGSPSCIFESTFTQCVTIPGYVFNFFHVDTIFGICCSRNYFISVLSHERRCVNISGALEHKGHASESMRPHFLLIVMVLRNWWNVLR